MSEILPYPVDEKMLKQMRSRILFTGMLGVKLPLALFAGVKIDNIDPYRCEVSLPFGWRSQNPFRSIYFAAQCMAAEMSTGALAILAIKSAENSVAMLVTGMSAEFGKKATERSVFTCENGLDVFNAINHTIETGEGVRQKMVTTGRMLNGTEISQFTFEWSFKKRRSK
jgi:hypothetical protein